MRREVSGLGDDGVNSGDHRRRWRAHRPELGGLSAEVCQQAPAYLCFPLSFRAGAQGTHVAFDHTLMRPLCLAVVLLTVLPACNGQVDIAKPDGPGDDPGVQRHACNGALGSAPRVLVGGLGEGWLFVDGDHLVYVEELPGAVRRIDRCSGEASVIATATHVTSAALRNGSVYLVENGDDPGFDNLLRVPIAGDTTDVVAQAPAGARLVAHASGVFLKASIETEQHDPGIFELDEAAGTVSLRHQLDTWEGIKQISLIGASDAGLYFKESYDCGCNAGLKLWPFDGSETSGVPGTAGAWSLATVGDDLFVGSELEPVGFGSVVLDIVRLPLEGGEPDVLVPANEEHTYDVRKIAANATAVCWTNYAGPPRCIRPATGASLRLMDEDDDQAAPQALVLAEDAAYWMRREKDGASFQIVGAVP